MKLAFLDITTTGIYAKEDGIIELVVIRVCNADVETASVFHEFINPQQPIPKEITGIHGINNAKVKDALTFTAINREFLNFIDGCTLMIHNPEFVLAFITNELPKSELQSFEKVECINGLENARRIHSGKGHSLRALADRYNVTIEERTQNPALDAARLLMNVYFAMGLKWVTSTADRYFYTPFREEKIYDTSLCLTEPHYEKVTLRIGDYETELGVECQQKLAEVIPDYPAYKDLFEILAKSNNTAIRASMASKENLSEDTVTTLLNDPEIEVVLAVLNNDYGKKFATNKQVFRAIRNAPRKELWFLFTCIENCTQLNQQEIIQTIFALGDPSVSIDVATKIFGCPDAISEALNLFADKDIRAVAQSNLGMN